MLLEMIDYYTWSIIIFIVILGLLIYKDRKHFERDAFILVRRTLHGRDFISNIGKNHPLFWKIMGNIAIIAVFVASILTLGWMVYNVYDILISEIAMPALAAVIPTTSTTATIGPGYFAVPFWFWVIPIILLLVVHEGFHGIMSGREGVKIKSMGVGILAVLPLAFVEPDEKQIVKKPMMSQLRIFAAGSYANFLVAGISALILMFGFVGLSLVSGVGFSGYTEGYPAADVNLTGIITKINDYDIHTTDDLHKALLEIGAGQEVTIETLLVHNDGSFETLTYTLVTAAGPEGTDDEKGYIGITFEGINPNMNILRPEYEPYREVIVFIQGLIYFMFLINLGVGLFNTFPIKFLDGGRMFELVFLRISKKKGPTMMKALTFFTLIVILLNIALPFIKPLFMV